MPLHKNKNLDPRVIINHQFLIHQQNTWKKMCTVNYLLYNNIYDSKTFPFCLNLVFVKTVQPWKLIIIGQDQNKW